MTIEDPQITNREMMDLGNINVYGNEVEFGYGMNQMENGIYFPVDTILPDDRSMFISSKKRSRDWCSFDQSFPGAQFVNQNQSNRQNGIISFHCQDISMQIYQQQEEIDWLIAHHTETIRSEIAATRTRNTMRLIAAAVEGMKKRLRSKEEEIEKTVRWNHALEEKLKSLSEENEIWQQIAQTNEDRANVLRRNLHKILTQQQLQHHHADKITVVDVESCCGSKDEHQQRTLAKVDTLNHGNDVNAYCTTTTTDNNGSRWCRNCGKEEFCVLMIPCRHLCICTVCESLINFCPICKCSKTATVHVNMNSF